MTYLNPYSDPVNTLKNHSGFGSNLLLTFVAIFSSLLVVAAFVRFTIDSRSDFRFYCYNDLYSVQKILINHEHQLMALNPLAHSLRIRLRILYIQLATAVATENLPWVAQTTQWILQTKQQQQALKIQQRLLITFGNSYARLELMRAHGDLIAKNHLRSRAWSEILQIQNNITLNTWSPKMAVSPDSKTDIAPAYKYNPEFEIQQRITATWVFWFFAKPEFQTLIEARSNWRLQCSSEPRNQNGRLSPQVKADKL